MIVLARIDINGPPHRNPEGQPYKPGQWLKGVHLHLYKEGFDDRIGFDVADVEGFNTNVATDQDMLVSFLEFCAVQPIPRIQARL